MQKNEFDRQVIAPAIGISRVNLTRRDVEAVNYYRWGDYTEQLRDEVDYRKRIETIFTDIHLSDADNADLQPEALMNMYLGGVDTVSKIFWAECRDTHEVIWVRVDVRIAKQTQTGNLVAFFSNWDVTRERNLNQMMELVIQFDYDYVKYISSRTGYFEVIVAEENVYLFPDRQGRDYDDEIRRYLTQIAVTDQLEEDIRAMQLPAILAHLEKEQLYMYEIDIREPDGSVRRKMFRYAYMNREMGTIIKSCTDIEDIVNEEKKKQEQLELALEAAERANGAKSEFLAHMSHDIRTPMNAIIGVTAIAKEECKDETILEYLDKIDGASKFLLGLINDILDISKIESGNLKLKPQVFHREDFDHAIDTTIRPLMKKKNLEFRYNMNCGVDCIYVDIVRFKQIFFNILSNAAKFTPEGGIVDFAAEHLRSGKDEQWVRFFIRDTGIGMSEEFVKHAFEPFEQEQNREIAQQWQGTGLGLPIVKKLVTLMEGEISINSEIGKGTEVVIDLPLTLAEKDMLDERWGKEQAVDGLKSKRVLVVEDNEINTFVARRILESRGICVEHAENGREAVEAFARSEKGHFDLILMDVRMPVMNGLDATREIRKMSRPDALQIPIIAMSANAYDEDMQMSIAAGMNAHLAKPIEPVLLLKTIENYVIK